MYIQYIFIIGSADYITGFPIFTKTTIKRKTINNSTCTIVILNNLA